MPKRNITLQEEDLVHFARRVLHILEHTEDWDADMLDEIADCAHCHDIATLDERGNFKATVKTLD